MAINAVSFDTASGSSVSSLATNSKTWVAGRVYVIFVANYGPSSADVTPTIAGCTQLGTWEPQVGSSRITMFSFLGDGSTGTKTISFGGTTQTQVQYTCDEWRGVATTGTNASDAFVQIVTNSGGGTAMSATLSTFGHSQNATAAYGWNQGGNVETAGTGFTSLSTNSSFWYVFSEWEASNNTAPAMTQSVGTGWFMVAFEMAIIRGTHVIGQAIGAGTTSAIDTTGAKTLVIVDVADFGSTDSAPTDNKGNTYTVVSKGQGTSRVSCRISVCLSPTSVGSGHTASSSPVHGFDAIALFAYDQPLTLGPTNHFDSTGSGDTTISPGSVTPTNNGAVIVAGASIDDYATGTGDTFSVSSPFTDLISIDVVPGTRFGLVAADLIQETAATVSPTFTRSQAAGQSGDAGAIVVLYPPSIMCMAHTSTHAPSSATGGGTTVGIDTTGAKFLVAVCAFGSGSSPTMSDSKGNTWTQLTDWGGANFQHSTIFYAKNPTVGSEHTFTMGGSSFVTYGAFAVGAFTGIDTVSPYDTQNGAGQTTGATLNTGSITPSSNGELIIAAFGADQLATPISIDSSFNLLETVEYIVTQNCAVGFAFLVQATAAAINPTWTRGQNTSSQSSAAIASFKAAGGASSSFVQTYLRLNQAVQRAATW